MAQVYKQHNGKGGRANKNYTIRFWNHQGRRCIATGYEDKVRSDALADQIEYVKKLKLQHLPWDDAAQRFIANAPQSILDALVRADLIDGVGIARQAPISEHIAIFCEHLKLSGSQQRQISLIESRLRSIFYGVTLHTQITEAMIQKAMLRIKIQPRIPEGKKKPMVIGTATYNAYVTHLKHFCGWLCKQGILTNDPSVTIRKLQVTDQKIRRALTVQEIGKLFRAVYDVGPAMVPPEDRALYYEFALNTGLRLSEINALLVGDFNLDCENPFVTVQAKHTKNKRVATVHIKVTLAQKLKSVFKCKDSGAKAFNMPSKFYITDVLRRDLKAAGIAHSNAQGVVDFHSLRHTYITLLAPHCNLMELQAAARHANISTTERYAHLCTNAWSIADKLPNF